MDEQWKYNGCIKLKENKDTVRLQIQNIGLTEDMFDECLRICEDNGYNTFSIAITLVPDPESEWKITDVKVLARKDRVNIIEKWNEDPWIQDYEITDDYEFVKLAWLDEEDGNLVELYQGGVYVRK